MAELDAGEAGLRYSQDSISGRLDRRSYLELAEMDAVATGYVLLTSFQYTSIAIGTRWRSYLVFPEVTEDGNTEDHEVVDGRLDGTFAFEIGVTVGGVVLREVVSPSTVHL